MRGLFFALIIALGLTHFASAGVPTLPMEKRFIGQERFRKMVAIAHEKNWAAMPLSQRIVAAGEYLLGTPYKGFTLEIDDHIEAPSVNLEGVDCWTFFEISLGFARMLNDPAKQHTPERLLYYVELDRYRNGACTGDYLSRLHYLEDWIVDNQQRGWVRNVTEDLGGLRMPFRECREMTVLWKSYRYLRENPELREGIKEHEERISRIPVWQIPKARVEAIEDEIQDGDILCITSNDESGYTSHVGIAARAADGLLHFLHASSNYKRVVLDKRLSEYLADFSTHSGVYIARPLK